RYRPGRLARPPATASTTGPTTGQQPQLVNLRRTQPAARRPLATGTATLAPQRPPATTGFSLLASQRCRTLATAQRPTTPRLRTKSTANPGPRTAPLGGTGRRHLPVRQPRRHGHRRRTNPQRTTRPNPPA